MTAPKLKDLQIIGDISIEPITSKVPDHSRKCLVMGPTGAGKSSFIEALAGKAQDLQISKDQLSGYTQKVSAYLVVNVCNRMEQPEYLIDTPGFSDSKLSEIEIIDMIRQWMRDNDLRYFEGIFYVMPITETRLAGSRRRTLEMLKGFLWPDGSLAPITFVTTMWDVINNKAAQRRAESNFVQLRDEIFKDFLDSHAQITRFYNTKDSALQVMDLPYFATSVFRSTYSRIGVTTELYLDLHERIEGALREKRVIETELDQPDSHTDIELRAIFERNQKDNYDVLIKFIKKFTQISHFPAEYKQPVQFLRKAIAREVTPMDSHYEALFRQWAQEPTIPGDKAKIDDQQPSIYVSESLHSKSLDVRLGNEHPRRTLALKGLLRRLFKVAKRRGSKWLKRTA